MSIVMRGLSRNFSRFRKTSVEGESNTKKTRILSSFTAEAQVFGRHALINQRLNSVLEVNAFGRDSDPPSPESLDVIFHHPHIDSEFILSVHSSTAVERAKYQQIIADSRESLEVLVDQSTNTRVDSRFIHTDLLLKRDSKQQVTLLVDGNSFGQSDKKGFYLCPVDTAVTRSNLRWADSFDRSLVFLNVTHSLAETSTIVARCDRCGRNSHWNESMLNSYASIKCQTVNCNPDLIHLEKSSSLNPGGGRNYWGPIVPNLRNVWLGLVDNFRCKRTDHVGILTATVFRIFKDPSSGRSKKVNLPNPDPRIQWCILPIHTS